MSRNDWINLPSGQYTREQAISFLDNLATERDNITSTIQPAENLYRRFSIFKGSLETRADVGASTLAKLTAGGSDLKGADPMDQAPASGQKPREAKTLSSGHQSAKSAAMTREEIDAKQAATEARMEATEHRIDARITEATASLRVLEANVSNLTANVGALPKLGQIIWAVAGGAVAVIGVVGLILSYGGDRFDGGVQVTSASVQAATDALNISKQNAQQIEMLTGRIDAVLNALARQAPLDRPAEPGR
jgi:hypothetical protein